MCVFEGGGGVEGDVVVVVGGVLLELLGSGCWVGCM